MWDEQRWKHFQALRQREQEGALSGSERTELTSLVEEIEGEEARHLDPATERLRHERECLAARNDALHALVARKEALAARLRAVIAEVEEERQAINHDLAQIVHDGTAAVNASVD